MVEKKTVWDLDRPSPEAYRAVPKLPLRLVLDNVRSLNNIGSMFRTSDALAIEGIDLIGVSGTPPSPEIHKTALGAELTVDWRYFPAWPECVAALRADGYVVCALEQVKGSVALQDFHPASGHRYAVVVGHEVHGVDPGLVNAADVCLEIPQYGTKHSFNVAVSAAIALWQLSLAMRAM